MITVPPRHLVSLSLGVTLLAGCGGSQTFAPAASPRTAGARSALPSLLRYVPGHGGQVQYVSDEYSGDLIEFDYPKGTSPIGKISGASGGECTKGARTFWVAQGESIAEYAVGGKKPIKTLKVAASGCAIDSTTGDLAVTTSSGVVIFKKARGSGKPLSDLLSKSYFLGYDSKGNLFVDGFTGNDKTGLSALAKGRSSFKVLTLSNSVEFPGAVQWDGKYITLGDQETQVIYGYTCSVTSCTLERTVSLSGSSDCVQTWIAEGFLFCPDAGNDDVEVYDYPAGGSPIALLTYGSDFPSAVVSLSVR